MILLKKRQFAASYYLMGYSVECALKACIAKQFQRFAFPDKQIVQDSYTHNLVNLLSLSGLEDTLHRDSRLNPVLKANWATVKRDFAPSTIELVWILNHHPVEIGIHARDILAVGPEFVDLRASFKTVLTWFGSTQSKAILGVPRSATTLASTTCCCG